MKTLAPVDFKAVAAQGCFVYCYLRADGSPYYVGIAKKASRPQERHNWRPPSCPCRIRVLRSGLSWSEAQQWERFYIARYGRKDTGTGILRNLTDGGEGSTGRIRSDAERKVLSEKARIRQNDPEWKKAHPAKTGFKRDAEFCRIASAAQKQRFLNMSDKEKADQAKLLKDRTGAFHVREKMSRTHKLRWEDQALRDAWSKQVKEELASGVRSLERLKEMGRNSLATPEARAKHSLALAAANAKEDVKMRRSAAAKAIAPEVKERVAQARRDAFAAKLERQAADAGMGVDEFVAHRKQVRTAKKVEQNRQRRLRAQELG